MSVLAFFQILLLGLLLSVGSPRPAAAQHQVQQLYQVPGTPEAPDFALNDIDGGVHTLSEYRGKVVLINFWATWCPPCREEMPAMQRAWQQLREEDVVFLAVDVGEDEDTIFRFTADYPVDFPLLMDIDSSVIQKWPVRGLPTTFIIDKQGRITYRAIGARDWDAAGLLDRIRALK
ncbi:MAG: TlpA family protein disulfide reductase [Thiogranum sp.]|nr:TlpA family protein disulfide reductase [Thiogranum sp.]